MEVIAVLRKLLFVAPPRITREEAIAIVKADFTTRHGDWDLFPPHMRPSPWIAHVGLRCYWVRLYKSKDGHTYVVDTIDGRIKR